MKKAFLIASSALLLFVLVAVYLVFIHKNIYVLNLNPRYSLQLINENFKNANQVVTASPNFKKNLLVIFSNNTKPTNDSSSVLLEPPDVFSTLYYSEWQETALFDILHIYIIDETFISSLRTGIPATNPVKNLMYFLNSRLSKRYNIYTQIINPSVGGFIELRQK